MNQVQQTPTNGDLESTLPTSLPAEVPFDKRLEAANSNYHQDENAAIGDIIGGLMGSIDLSVLDRTVPGASLMLGMIPAALASFDIASLPYDTRLEIARGMRSMLDQLYILAAAIEG